MPEIHYASVYIAAAAWIVQRAFADEADRGQAVRSGVVAGLIGAASLFLPMRSGIMVALLCAAFLAGVMGLTVLFANKFGRGQRTFSGTLLVQFGLMFLAMLMMSAPLALIAWAGAR